MTKPRDLYLGKYLIALYDETDRCVFVADTPRELWLASDLPKTEEWLRNVRCKCAFTKRGMGVFMMWGSRRCKMHLIPWEEDDAV